MREAATPTRARFISHVARAKVINVIVDEGRIYAGQFTEKG